MKTNTLKIVHTLRSDAEAGVVEHAIGELLKSRGFTFTGSGKDTSVPDGEREVCFEIKLKTEEVEDRAVTCLQCEGKGWISEKSQAKSEANYCQCEDCKIGREML